MSAREDIVKMFGANLISARLEKCYTQYELAEKMGLNSRIIYRYESGTHLPGVVNLVRLAKILDTTVDDLLGV